MGCGGCAVIFQGQAGANDFWAIKRCPNANGENSGKALPYNLDFETGLLVMFDMMTNWDRIKDLGEFESKEQAFEAAMGVEEVDWTGQLSKLAGEVEFQKEEKSYGNDSESLGQAAEITEVENDGSGKSSEA